MTFDSSINLGNVLTFGALAFALWRYQITNIATQNKMHTDNVERMVRLETKVDILYDNRWNKVLNEIKILREGES